MKKFRPGVGFGDFVVRDSAVRKSRVNDNAPADYRKGWLVWMVVLVLFGILSVRLVSLQLYFGGRYLQLSEENRIKTIKLPAPRGIIYDRNGVELAMNEKKGEKWVRRYPLGPAFAHVLGYVSEINADEVGLLKNLGDKYGVGDLMGRAGIEATYEESLRGRGGGRLVEVDHQGKEVRELGKRDPVPGQALKLTIDSGLQEAAYRAMEQRKGAVVASNPKTGEVLALVSSPSFDTNTLGVQYSFLSTQRDLPMFNRAIGAIYPPGSTFKMTVIAAAISEKRVEPDFTYTDLGIIRVGDFSYTNWLFTKRGGTEGTIGFVRALTRSTDTFFYKVGEMTTPELIAKWANLLGMGKKTGIDLPGEVEGLIPTPDWKLKTKGEQWFLGNTYHMAIGQGDVLVTPVQVNLMTNILATGGKGCKLRVGRGRLGEACPVVDISPEVLKIIKQGMVGACSPDGTAFPMFDWNEAASAKASASQWAASINKNPLPLIACKTGTAEYVTEDGKTRSHGWLTAFAPADDPVISVTVVMEGGGEGSNVAAPVVRQILAKYFGVSDTYPYKNIPQEISE